MTFSMLNVNVFNSNIFYNLIMILIRLIFTLVGNKVKRYVIGSTQISLVLHATDTLKVVINQVPSKITI